MTFPLLLDATLVFASILLTPLSTRIGAPVVVTVFGCRMLLGEDGPGGMTWSTV